MTSPRIQDDTEVAARSRAGTSPAQASALQETTAAYDLNADDIAEKQWTVDFARYLQPFVDLLMDRGLPVIDAGCGAGRDVAAIVAQGVPCIGVDISEGMLAIARARVRDPLASWLRADLRSIPLDDGVAGGVWTNAALLHLEPSEHQAALVEFRRLVRPGSPLFISTQAEARRSFRAEAHGTRRWFWGTDEDVLDAAVTQAGFEIVSSATEPGIVRGTWINVLAVARDEDDRSNRRPDPRRGT